MSKLLKVIDNLAIVYGRQEPFVTKAAKHMNASCKEGCIGCCYQMATITIPEGLMLANVILKRDDWLQLATAMREPALKSQRPGISTTDYFKSKIPCPLLDEEKRACKVYDHRPSPCRYLYVVTSPEKCYPESTDPNIAHIDFMEQEAIVWKFASEALGNEIGMLVAPLPIMTLHCMTLLAKSLYQDRILVIRQLLDGVMNPKEWTEKIFITIQRNTTEDEQRSIINALQKVGAV